MTEEKKSRKPYKTPAVRTEKLYERAALACGKINPLRVPPQGCGSQCRPPRNNKKS